MPAPGAGLLIFYSWNTCEADEAVRAIIQIQPAAAFADVLKPERVDSITNHIENGCPAGGMTFFNSKLRPDPLVQFVDLLVRAVARSFIHMRTRGTYIIRSIHNLNRGLR